MSEAKLEVGRVRPEYWARLSIMLPVINATAAEVEVAVIEVVCEAFDD